MTRRLESTSPRWRIFAFLLLALAIVLMGTAWTAIDPRSQSTLGFERLGQRTVATASTVAWLAGAAGMAAMLALVLGRGKTALLTLGMILTLTGILTGLAQGASIDLIGMLAASLRMSTPIALGALAGILCERSGIVNIGIEGMMLASAAFGFAASLYLDNIWLGVMAAVLMGGLMAALHAVMSIRFKTDQIISGTAINILAVGASGYLRRAYLVKAYFVGTTLPLIRLPVLSQLPIVGSVLFSSQPIVYLMLILLVVTDYVLFHTPWGLRSRAVGEHPRAADTLGVDVYLIQYVNVIVAGCIAGLAGAWFSLETVGSFEDMMTGGKGFIALAAVIFGNWTPRGAFLGALLFGFADALQIKLQILNVPLPYQFLGMAPYLITMVVLAGLIGRTTPPAATGQAYER